MEQAIESIKTALVNTLSMDQGLRDQANQFLIKQCEPDPQFQIALLHIIKNACSARVNTNAVVLESGGNAVAGASSLPNSQAPADVQPTAAEI